MLISKKDIEDIMTFLTKFCLFLLQVCIMVNVFYAQDEYEQEAYPEESYAEETYSEEYSDEYSQEQQTEYENQNDENSVSDPQMISEETNIQNTNTVSSTNTNPSEEIITKQTLILPILEDYKPAITVNPENPQLPDNNQIKKLRGSIWKGNKKILMTNNNGVVSQQRAYLFFATNEDAIAYQYAPYSSQNMPFAPRPSDYIPLIPLLETNTLPDLSSISLTKYSNLSPQTNQLPFEIQFDVVTPELDMLNSSNNSSEVTSVQPTTNSDIFNSDMNQDPITSVEVIAVEQNTESEDEVFDELVEQAVIEDEENTYSEEENIDAESSEEEYQNEDEYTQTEYEETITEDEQYVQLTQMTQAFVAQLISTLSKNQYVLNIGGQTSGIFVHKTNNIEKPYKVIFLSLEEGIVLYEFSIENSFDVRLSDSQASKDARELYIKILNEKINFQKYNKMSNLYFQ